MAFHMANKHILLIEDSTSLAVVYQGYLARMPYQVDAVETGADALQQLKQQTPDIVLLDLQLPDMEGMQILRHIQQQQLNCAVIIITAHGSINGAVDAMREGAFDFISKPVSAERLLVTINNAFKHQELNNLVAHYRQEYDRDRYCGFIGKSPRMQAVYRIIDNAASSKASVFITGESGTGKELCAEALHQQSPRREQPFIALNCAAIPKELIESEIFGHVKGAFTGAQQARDGAATLSDGGTLFLDELCEMDLELQSKLLRFIQTGTFQKVGSSKLETVDVRFVCATNRDPFAEVQAGRFREDLYYRLHVIPIELPSLREREQDVLLIAEHLLRQYSREEGKQFEQFSEAVAQTLQHYDWPGNIRQLQNVIRNIVVLHDDKCVASEMLPAPLNQLPALQKTPIKTETAHADTANNQPNTPAHNGPSVYDAQGQVKPLWLIEKDAIEFMIEQCDGNIPKAAALLDISPSTIYRKKQSWEEKSAVG